MFVVKAPRKHKSLFSQRCPCMSRHFKVCFFFFCVSVGKMDDELAKNRRYAQQIGFTVLGFLLSVINILFFIGNERQGNRDSGGGGGYEKREKNKEGEQRSERDTDGGSGRKGHRPFCVQSS